MERLNYFYQITKQIIKFIEAHGDVTEPKKKSSFICLMNYCTRLEGYLMAVYNEKSNALDTKGILLRGCIEALLLVSIFQESDVSISECFLKQDECKIDKRNHRFNYLLKNGDYPHSLIELVDFSSVQNKIFLKFWIKICDHTTHPNIEPMDNITSWMNPFTLIEDLNTICLNHMRHLGFDAIIDQSITIEDAVEIIHDIPQSHIEFVSKNDVFMSLYNEFLNNYKDFYFAYVNDRKFLFYIKLRYILEFAGVFYLLVTNPHLIEPYRCHNTLQNADVYDYLLKVLPDKQVKEVVKAYRLVYEKKYHHLKEYYLNRFPTLDPVKLKHQMMHSNGFAIGVFHLKDKAPKTSDLITHVVNQLDLEGDMMVNLYVECCNYCHISSNAYEKFTAFYKEKVMIFNKVNSLFEKLFLCSKKVLK